MTLFRRILVEKRGLIVPIAVGLILNAAAYVFWVRPLGQASADMRGRAERAAQALQAAQREYDGAKGLVTGTSRAGEDLATFYGKVLPADIPAARRLTYLSVYQLARKMNVKFVERRTEIDQPEHDSRVGRLKIRTELQGDYENLRQFIYQLESSPEFVIIDDVTLTQNDPAKPLTLIIELSTYYRLDAANGN